MNIYARYSIAALLCFLLPGSCLSESIGFEVISRPHTLARLRGVVVLFGARFDDGMITSFSAYFNEPATNFAFQIWRPAPDYIDSRTFQLVAQIKAESNSIGFYMIQLTTPIVVQDGDRLGFSNAVDGSPPLAATFLDKSIHILYHSSSTWQPKITDNVTLVISKSANELSISAEFRPSPNPDEVGPVISGLTGATGNPGRLGPPGVTGAKGDPGLPGLVGNPGAKGDRGYTGSEGKVGPTGYVGHLGHTGATGQMGESGATGSTGYKGSKGSKGDAGPLGVSVIGGTGFTGAPGSPGASGPVGPSGTDGATGNTGTAGATGYTGSEGPIGVPGPVGNEGMQGPPGLVGPPGPPGPKGVRGPLFMDVDECSMETHYCEYKCVNNFGSYSCECNDGYELKSDGHSCQDIDECSIHNGGCQNVCQNIVGSYSCSCAAGTILGPNWRSCLDFSECSTEKGDCLADELCVNTYGSHHCVLNVPIVYNGQRPGKNKDNDANSVIVAASTIEDDIDLLTTNTMIGIFVWLTVLSIIIFSILLHLCMRKVTTKKYSINEPSDSNRRHFSSYNKDRVYY